MPTREETKAQTRKRILAAARHEIAERGGVGLSMRAVARQSDLVSSAVYRYFPTREDLLTAMIIESYEHLATVLQTAEDAVPADRWRALATSLRAWAGAHTHEFQLIYGTPVPGYVAPPETVPAAAAVAQPFLQTAASSHPTFPTSASLREQLAGPAAELDVTPPQLAAVLAELAALIGAVSLELAGHLVGTADPAGPLYEALIDRQIGTLALRG